MKGLIAFCFGVGVGTFSFMYMEHVIGKGVEKTIKEGRKAAELSRTETGCYILWSITDEEWDNARKKFAERFGQ